MTILIFILKIIGIILLVFILTLLLLLGLLLFCPIRYKLNGENENLTYDANINISWLLFVLRFKGKFNSEFYSYSLRLFGYTILQYPKIKKEKKYRNYKKKKKRNQIKSKHNLEAKTNLESTVEPDYKIQEKEQAVFLEDKTKTNVSKETLLIEKADTNDTKNKWFYKVYNIVKDMQSKGKAFLDKIKQILKNLIQAFQKAKEKATFLREKYQEIMLQIKDSRNKEAIKHIWKEIKYLLVHFRPRKIIGEAIFATSDPALTGQITGAICLFPFFYAYKVHVVPDFEMDEFYLKSNFYIKGHIRLIHVLLVGIRVLLDKNIMKWIKKIL